MLWTRFMRLHIVLKLLIPCILVSVIVLPLVTTISRVHTVHATSPTATYTATDTIPVPPASTYAGSAGGDGWAVAMTPTAVYNVFHHSSILQVACHLQKDASPCWAPETITDTKGNNFATSGQPGLWLDQASNRLYVFATRTSDATGGVVCIDTAQAASNTDPFCGFTALTAIGNAPIQSGISGISDPVVVGTRWYAFNYVNGASVTGTQNMLLCFSLTTLSACGSQPFSVAIGSGSISVTAFPPPSVAVIGSQIIVPITVGGTDDLACFDGSASTACSGAWPVALGFSYDSGNGAAFPLMTGSGSITGLCLPSPGDPCYSLSGATIGTPAGMTAAIPQTSGWNGPAFVLGPRVYVPNGNSDQVDCYDYSLAGACASFPKSLSNVGLLYTVNADPQRPTCIWVNSDNGAGQIQNFDAYTGGACGQGPIRVLASSMVVPTQTCTPFQYTSLQVTSPAPSTYSSGSVAFQGGDGNSIPGLADHPLDKTGTVSLTGLNLSTSTGLPQFLITLVGEQGTPGSVVVQLTWTGTDDPSCVKPGTVVNPPPPTTCASATFIAVSGSGEHYKSATDLAISPELQHVYKAMMSRLGGRQVSVQVLNYPAYSTDILFKINNPSNFFEKIIDDHASRMWALYQIVHANLPKYLKGKDEGVAALRATISQVRSSCPNQQIVLAGYSQGAMVIHQFLEELTTRNDAATISAIRAVVLIGDPDRVSDSQVLNFGSAAWTEYGLCSLPALSRTACTRSLQLTDVPAVFLPVTIEECEQYDVVCDTGELIRDFKVNTPTGWNLAVELGKTEHTGFYRWSLVTTRVGYWAARLLLKSK